RKTYDAFKDSLDGACRRAYCHAENLERLDRGETLAREKQLTIPQIALAYVMSQPMNVFACVGAADASELAACVEASTVRLTAAEIAWLDLRSESR
ncbi:MAG TPA: aldo/keto reductase, partial [Candidatus Latescibacteria bacterium]|nr:aldo/keto reductase [Candidatus Latescibacterota bacterium]